MPQQFNEIFFPDNKIKEIHLKYPVQHLVCVINMSASMAQLTNTEPSWIYNI